MHLKHQMQNAESAQMQLELSKQVAKLSLLPLLSGMLQPYQYAMSPGHCSDAWQFVAAGPADIVPNNTFWMLVIHGGVCAPLRAQAHFFRNFRFLSILLMHLPLLL